jgi:predicted nuclease of predicted toxin-antitoxin system
MVIEGLRRAGHDVLAVRDAWRGVGDRAVIEGARRERWALVTEDKGFGELVVRHRLGVPGLLLVRYAQKDARAVLARLLSLVDRHGESLHQMYAVVTRARRGCEGSMRLAPFARK